MNLDDAKPISTLGERLLEGVRNLWVEVKRLGKVVDHQGLEVEQIKKRAAALERDLRGLRISRGRLQAKNERLEAALAESSDKLTTIKSLIQ